MTQEQLNEIRKQCERCREYAGDHELIISLVDEIERLRGLYTEEFDRAEKRCQEIEQMGVLCAKIQKQLEISDQYAAEHKKDSVLPTVWELQNGHIRDVAQEILKVVQEE